MSLAAFSLFSLPIVQEYDVAAVPDWGDEPLLAVDVLDENANVSTQKVYVRVISNKIIQYTEHYSYNDYSCEIHHFLLAAALFEHHLEVAVKILTTSTWKRPLMCFNFHFRIMYHHQWMSGASVENVMAGHAPR